MCPRPRSSGLLFICLPPPGHPIPWVLGVFPVGKHLSFPTKPACGHRLLLQRSSASSSSSSAPPSSSSLRPRPAPHRQITSFSPPSFPPEFQHVGRDARPWSRALCVPVSSSNSLGVFSISPFPGTISWFLSLGDRGQVRGGTSSPAAAMALCLGEGIGVGKRSREYFYIFPSFFFLSLSSFFFSLFPKD